MSMKLLSFITKHPLATILFYTAINVVLWGHLPNLRLASMDSFMVSGKSDTHIAANIINSIFRENRNPYAIYRSTKLESWLELLVVPAPKSKTDNLLTEHSVREMQQIDRFLQDFTIQASLSKIKMDKVIPTMPLLNKSRMSYKLSDICQKELLNRCSIDGSYVLDEDFIDDVIYNDVHYSKSDFYARGSRRSPSYGPYMFGKAIRLSKNGMIEHVNAIRFRYNLDSDGTLNWTITDGSTEWIEKKELVDLWLRSVAEHLQNIAFYNISVIFSTSLLLIETPIQHFYQGVPLAIVAIIVYTVCIWLFLSWIVIDKPHSYVVCLLAVLSSYTMTATVVAVITFFRYKPSAPSLVNCLPIILLGNLCLATIISAFEGSERRKEWADEVNKSVLTLCSILCRSTLICGCVIKICDFVGASNDVRSNAIVAAVGCIILLTHSLFIYLPICSILYIKRIPKSIGPNELHPQPAHRLKKSRCVDNPARLLQSCNRNRDSTFQVSETSRAERRVSKVLTQLITSCLSVKLVYIFLATLILSALTLVSLFVIIRFRLRHCELTQLSNDGNAKNRSLDGQLQGEEQQSRQAKTNWHCSFQARKVNLMRQSDLVTPSQTSLISKNRLPHTAKGTKCIKSSWSRDQTSFTSKHEMASQCSFAI